MSDIFNLQLPSGRKIYSVSDTIGIDGDLEIACGYDDAPAMPDHSELTVEAKRDLADMMIERWTRYRARLDESAEGTGGR